MRKTNAHVLLITFWTLFAWFPQVGAAQSIIPEPVKSVFGLGVPFQDLLGRNVKEVVAVDYAEWKKDTAQSGSRTFRVRSERYEKGVFQLDREGRLVHGETWFQVDEGISGSIEESYKYDRHGNLTEHFLDFKSDEGDSLKFFEKTKLEYDGKGRVTAEDRTSNFVNFFFSEDQLTTRYSYTYNPRNRTCAYQRHKDPQALNSPENDRHKYTDSLYFDAAGRLVEIRDFFGEDPWRLTSQFKYDRNGRLTHSREFSLGKLSNEQKYAYHPNGMVKQFRGINYYESSTDVTDFYFFFRPDGLPDRVVIKYSDNGREPEHLKYLYEFY